MRFWTEARSHEEILENMNSVLNGSETNLAAYYNFDLSSGTSLLDIVGSNDGTLTNMAGSEWTSAGWETFAQNAAIFSKRRIRYFHRNLRRVNDDRCCILKR